MRKILTIMLLAAVTLSCEKTKETVISGKVVTFREDSLLYTGPIEVTLYKSVGSPGDEVETKLLWPPYEFHFVTEATDFVYEGFQVGIDSYVPGHAKHYAGDAEYILEGETVNNYVVNLYPHTCIAYELINQGPQLADFISFRRLGGGAYTINGVAQDRVIDCGYMNGPAIIKYGVGRNGETTIYFDTIMTAPFDTTYHTLVY